MGCLNEHLNSEFDARMEDALDLYAEPYNPKRPMIRFDEKSKQLIGETRTLLPPKPGRVARHDYEYKRNGTTGVNSRSSFRM